MILPPTARPPLGLGECLLGDGLPVLEPLAVSVYAAGSSMFWRKDDPRGLVGAAVGGVGGGGGEFDLGSAGAAEGGGGGGAELGDWVAWPAARIAA